MQGHAMEASIPCLIFAHTPLAQTKQRSSPFWSKHPGSVTPTDLMIVLWVLSTIQAPQPRGPITTYH